MLYNKLHVICLHQHYFSYFPAKQTILTKCNWVTLLLNTNTDFLYNVWNSIHFSSPLLSLKWQLNQHFSKSQKNYPYGNNNSQFYCLIVKKKIATHKFIWSSMLIKNWTIKSSRTELRIWQRKLGIWELSEQFILISRLFQNLDLI